ncbi:succinate dehydrogenase, cytochrome b556 subunit [Paracoccaceae bacterium GXU_MW_L88]
MADVNRGKRPLSPFMIGPYYRPQLTSMTSIVHRITGCALGLAGILVVWWFVALAIGPDAYATANWWLTSYVGDLIFFGALWAILYHMLNGIRHLVWDTGRGLEVQTAEKLGVIVIGLSLVFTIILAFAL